MKSGWLASALLSLLTLILLSSTAAYAQRIDIAQLEDNHLDSLTAHFSYIQNQVTPDQIRNIINSNAWQPAADAPLDNFGDQQTYFRLQLTNSSTEDIDLLLVQDNPQLILISSWIQQHNTLTDSWQLGATLPFDQRPIKHRKFIFPYTLPAGEDADIYLHISGGARDMVTRTSLWHSDQFFQTVHNLDLWEVFYFGIVSVMALYNLVIFGMVRDRSYLFYALFVGSALLTFVCISGHGFKSLWPNYPWLNHKAVYAGMGLMIAFAGWFSISFLNLREAMPRLAKTLNRLAWFVIALILLIMIMPLDPQFTLVRILGSASAPIYLLCWAGGIHLMRIRRDTASKIYVAAWSMLILAIISTLLHEAVFTLFPIPTYTAVQIAHCIEVILLSMALAHHINILKVRENIAAAKATEQTRFLARMSHEIRTPMNGIIGMTDLLSDRVEDETSKRYLEVIHSSADTLEKVINDILDYSKIEAGKLEIRPHNFNLKKMTTNVVRLFELSSRKKSLQLTLTLDEQLADNYYGDSHRLQQVLTNLVSNAIKYTHQGAIHIEVKPENDQLCFKVSDTGEGIAEVDQQRLFEPFEQARNNNLGRESSTGLGLAICRELMQLMQGEIGLDSTLGEGSCFWFRLKLDAVESSEQQDADHRDDVELPTLRILVAEDNQVNQVVIKNLLQSLEQEITLVSNGLEAVGCYKDSHKDIDLILMDCEMPAMDGFKATEIIRQFETDEQLPAKPIIALTAHTLHKELQHCFDSGMDDLLLKPVTRDKVRNCLLKHLP